MKHFWRNFTLTTAAIAGIVATTLVALAAWDHNPQGEFHDWETGAIHWDAFGPLLALAFAAPFLLIVVLSGIVYAVAVAFRRKPS